MNCLLFEQCLFSEISIYDFSYFCACFNFVENITKVGPRIKIGFIHKVNFYIRLTHRNIVHCNT